MYLYNYYYYTSSWKLSVTSSGKVQVPHVITASARRELKRCD